MTLLLAPILVIVSLIVAGIVALVSQFDFSGFLRVLYFDFVILSWCVLDTSLRERNTRTCPRPVVSDEP